MKVPGLKTLKQSTRWLRSRFVNGTLILGYHRVTEASWDPYSMCIRPQNFSEQLAILKKYANPITLETLIYGLQNKNLPPRTVVITFDDGYADILYWAKPLLEQYQIPATVFMVTGYLGREFWWDELERTLVSPVTLPEELSLSINGETFRWISENTAHNNISDTRKKLLLSLYRLLLPLSSAQRQAAIVKISHWAGIKTDDRPQHRALTSDELLELSNGGLIDVGSHTITHSVLSRLSNNEQSIEIQQSKVYLEELLGRPITKFSYPNGALTYATQK